MLCAEEMGLQVTKSMFVKSMFAQSQPGKMILQISWLRRWRLLLVCDCYDDATGDGEEGGEEALPRGGRRVGF